MQNSDEKSTLADQSKSKVRTKQEPIDHETIWAKMGQSTEKREI